MPTLADPTSYSPNYDFSNYQANNPTTPLPAPQVDIQFANISDSSLSLRNAIMDVRRSDGALRNGIVTEDSLSVDLIDLITTETAADATAAAASASAAALSASGVATAEADLVAATAQLTAVANLVAAGGHFGDYGSITEAVGSSTDYGTIV